MERSYVQFNFPNMITVGLMVAVLYTCYYGITRYVMKAPGGAM